MFTFQQLPPIEILKHYHDLCDVSLYINCTRWWWAVALCFLYFHFVNPHNLCFLDMNAGSKIYKAICMNCKMIKASIFKFFTVLIFQQSVKIIDSSFTQSLIFCMKMFAFLFEICTKKCLLLWQGKYHLKSTVVIEFFEHFFFFLQ